MKSSDVSGYGLNLYFTDPLNKSMCELFNTTLNDSIKKINSTTNFGKK